MNENIEMENRSMTKIELIVFCVEENISYDPKWTKDKMLKEIELYILKEKGLI